MPRASVLKAGGWYARNGGPGTHVSARQEADTAARVAQLARREVGEEALGAPLEEANPQRDERHHSVRRDHHHVTAPVSRQTVRRAPKGFRPRSSRVTWTRARARDVMRSWDRYHKFPAKKATESSFGGFFAAPSSTNSRTRLRRRFIRSPTPLSVHRRRRSRMPLNATVRASWQSGSAIRPVGEAASRP